MAISTNRRSVMTLFSGVNDMNSQRVRILLAEKGVTAEIEYLDSPEKFEALRAINPRESIPTLVDRELIIDQVNVISEYLDERFPYPPLMHVSPIARARARLVIYRLEKELFPLVEKLITDAVSKDSQQSDTAQQVARYFAQLIPALNSSPFLLGEEFSVVDCALAPVLWRLPALKVPFSQAEARVLYQYADRLFKRDSFQVSLTEFELDVRKKELSYAT